MPESKLSISCRRSILGEVLRKAKTPWDARAKFQEFQGTKVAAACVKATEDCPVGQNSNSGATATSDSPFRTHAIPRRLLETRRRSIRQRAPGGAGWRALFCPSVLWAKQSRGKRDLLVVGLNCYVMGPQTSRQLHAPTDVA